MPGKRRSEDSKGLSLPLGGFVPSEIRLSVSRGSATLPERRARRKNGRQSRRSPFGGRLPSRALHAAPRCHQRATRARRGGCVGAPYGAGCYSRPTRLDQFAADSSYPAAPALRHFGDAASSVAAEVLSGLLMSAAEITRRRRSRGTRTMDMIGRAAALVRSSSAGPGIACGPPLRCCCSLPSPPGARHSSRSRHTRPTPLPADVTELFRVFGDAGADTVWIYEQGGPVHMLEDDPLRQFRHYPGRDAVLFAQVHQTLTIDNDLVSRHRELSFEELQAEVDVSIEILHRVIEHFKAQGKQVVVVGHSYGAFLTDPLPVAQGSRRRRPLSDHGRTPRHAAGSGRRSPRRPVLLLSRHGESGSVPSAAVPRCRSRSGKSWSCASWEPPATTATRSASPAPI